MLPKDTLIKGIGDCKVFDSYSWYKCLLETDRNPQRGYCMPFDEINLMSMYTGKLFKYSK